MPLAYCTKLLSDVATDVRRQFGDDSGTQITDADIARWTNRAQAEITRRGEINKTTINTPSVAGQNNYNLTGSNIFKILSIFYAGFPLENITFEQAQETILPEQNANNFTNATPSHWYEWGDSIYIYPTPVSSNDVIKLFIIQAPSILSVMSGGLVVPDTHYEILLAYVMKLAYELDEDFTSSGNKDSEMETLLADHMSTSSYKSYPTITVLPEDQ